MEKPRLHKLSTLTYIGDRLTVSRTIDPFPLSDPIRISLIPLSPGIDVEQCSALLQRNFIKHNLSCSIATSSNEDAECTSDFIISCANQSLDSWSKKIIGEGDFVLFLLNENYDYIDPDFQEEINAVPFKENQERWICIECDSNVAPITSDYGLLSSRVIKHMKYQYDQIAQAIHMPQLHLRLYNIDSNELAPLALVAALNQLYYNLSTVFYNSHNTKLVEFICKGMTHAEIITLMAEKKPEQNRFWTKQSQKPTGKQKLKELLELGSSEPTPLLVVRSKIPNQLQSTVTLDDGSDEDFFRSFRVPKPAVSTHNSIADWFNSYEELKVQFIKILLEMEKEYSNFELIPKL